jgi:ZIP family zinc transporter
LVLAIALHNIPEGLAVGVAFGAIASPELLNVEIFTLGSAVALAIGIGIQNFPEGFAVSLPLRRQGLSKFKSWQWGQLSAIVEPIFAVIGAAIVLQVLPILPYALAFAAGAMIFIVVEEVIPESQRGGNTDLATMGLIAGFIVMMMLDVGLG